MLSTPSYVYFLSQLSHTVPLKSKLPPLRATQISPWATGIAYRATKKKLQVHKVGLLRDLKWPLVITFKK